MYHRWEETRKGESGRLNLFSSEVPVSPAIWARFLTSGDRETAALPLRTEHGRVGATEAHRGELHVANVGVSFHGRGTSVYEKELWDEEACAAPGCSGMVLIIHATCWDKKMGGGGDFGPSKGGGLARCASARIFRTDCAARSTREHETPSEGVRVPKTGGRVTLDPRRGENMGAVRAENPPGPGTARDYLCDHDRHRDGTGTRQDS